MPITAVPANITNQIWFRLQQMPCYWRAKASDSRNWNAGVQDSSSSNTTRDAHQVTWSRLSSSKTPCWCHWKLLPGHTRNVNFINRCFSALPVTVKTGAFRQCILPPRRIHSRSGQLPKFIEDFPVVKFSWRSSQFFQRYEPNCGKMPHLAILKNP